MSPSSRPSDRPRFGMAMSSWRATASRRWGRECRRRGGGVRGVAAAGGGASPGWSPGPPPSPPRPLAAVDAAQLPRSYLYSGFTTVVDLAVFDRAFLDRLEAAPVHPHTYDCRGARPAGERG